MVRKVFKPEQIINKLREAEILLSQGSTVAEASRKLNVTEQTYYRWRKELEQENSRLKKLVADITLDNAILKEAARGNF
jgi:putative transposase